LLSKAFAQWAACCLLVAALALPPQAAWGGPLPVTEIAPGIYLHRGLHEETSTENLGAIANIGPDHVFGNAAFVEEDASFVGHAKLPRALAARGAYYLERLEQELGAAAEGSAVIAPGLTVSDRLDLDLGGRILTLTAHPTAHTDNDLTVLDQSTGTFWTGDLLFVERVPVIDGSLKGWLAVLDSLRALEPALVVPGHGPPTPDWQGALAPQERYFRTLLAEIRVILQTGGTMEQAVAGVGQEEKARWRLFEDYHPRNVVTAFTELEWE
jgi:quinoprotein relay system zinc metallohydrolase 2